MVTKRITLLFLILLVLVAFQPLSAEQPRYFEITLLTTNDLHANLQPFRVVDGKPDVTPSPENVGGAARRATIIREVRSTSSSPVFLLDSGDTTFGQTPTARAFHGAADVDMMNAIGYDAMVPGNHDFEWHSADTLRNLKSSRFPWICANLVNEKTGEPFLPTHIIREVGGVRIALFGLITSLVNNANYVGARELGLVQIDAAEVAKKLVPELRKEADIVILLSHLGVNPDVELAKAVPGIDAILGGHSHTRLAEPRLVSVGEPTALSLSAVPVVQAGHWGSDMGLTRLIFRRNPSTGRYELMSCKGKLVPINAAVPEDPEIAAIVQSYVERVKRTPEVAK